MDSVPSRLGEPLHPFRPRSLGLWLGALALAALGGGLGPPMLVGLLAAFFLALLAVEAFSRAPASAPSEVGH